MVATVGASGSGKSTLMNLLGCLDRPSGASICFCGQDTATLDALLARLRCHHFGFIFQRYHLLPHLDAAANVEIPAIYAGTARLDRRARARTLLTRLGLGRIAATTDPASSPAVSSSGSVLPGRSPTAAR